jgi:DNA-binding NtrC family response regulator
MWQRVFLKIIHQLSKRKHGQFIAIKLRSYPEGTIDSELFGHERAHLPVRMKPAKGILK